jgi:AcrR family transcriptional regulator
MTSWNFARLEQALRDFDTGAELPEPKRKKRNRILRAANDLILQHGYRRTSMDEVARTAGMAKGTVYLYFKNKHDLLIQLIVDEKKQYISRIQHVFAADVKPRERLRLYLKAAFTLANEMPLISRLLKGDREMSLVFEEMEPDTRDRSIDTITGFLTDMVDQAAAPHDLSRKELEDRARALAGLIHSAGMLADEQRFGLSLERFAEILADMVVDGVGASRDKNGE